MVGFETCGPNEAIVVSGMCLILLLILTSKLQNLKAQNFIICALLC
jgi:hypothetical protein